MSLSLLITVRPGLHVQAALTIGTVCIRACLHTLVHVYVQQEDRSRLLPIQVQELMMKAPTSSCTLQPCLDSNFNIEEDFMNIMKS